MHRQCWKQDRDITTCAISKWHRETIHRETIHWHAPVNDWNLAVSLGPQRGLYHQALDDPHDQAEKMQHSGAPNRVI